MIVIDTLSKSQRACHAAEALPEIEAEARERSALSSATRTLPPQHRVNGRGPAWDSVQVAGRRFGVSGSLVQRAKRIKEIDPELYERVKAGEVALQPAIEMYRHTQMPARTYAFREQRVAAIRELVVEGHRASQIASAIGISEGQVKNLARIAGITLPDAAIGRTPKIDVTRVVENTVEGLSGYVLGLKTIEGHEINVGPELIGEWVKSLTHSLHVLNQLRKHLRRAQRWQQTKSG